DDVPAALDLAGLGRVRTHQLSCRSSRSAERPRGRETPGHGRMRTSVRARRPSPGPARKSPASAFLGSAPFLFVLAAITLVSMSAITWVISPHWGGDENVVAAPRNVGEVPTDAGALVPYVSPNRIEIPAIEATAPIVRVGT